MIVTKFMDTIFRLGKNATENWQLIDDADLEDWWFHVDGLPSGHCIVETKILTDEMIQYGSKLVIENCKAKLLNKVTIIYIQVKSLKKTKTVGEVMLLDNPNKIIIHKN
jgi:predicted ribosome quality control (RQC) complex YloA/Tae2 family protein